MREIRALQGHWRSTEMLVVVAERVSSVFFRVFWGRVGANRDWVQIDAWARSIARTSETRAADLRQSGRGS